MVVVDYRAKHTVLIDENGTPTARSENCTPHLHRSALCPACRSAPDPLCWACEGTGVLPA